jgi:hypothetical protein
MVAVQAAASNLIAVVDTATTTKIYSRSGTNSRCGLWELLLSYINLLDIIQVLQ